VPGAQLDASRLQRRSHIETLFDRIYDDMLRNSEEDDDESQGDEDQAAIIEVDEARVAPNMHWGTSDKNKRVKFGNCQVEMIEYTHTRTSMFVHSIVREFIISFTNKLRRDDISINERLSLFQQAVVQVCFVNIGGVVVAIRERIARMC
jgi:hypothetical protein